MTGLPDGVLMRSAQPDDHARVMRVIDDWWGGRQMAQLLPRLFFEHFADSSFVAEDTHGLAGFLCGLLSQSRPGEAYIHFVGVRPDLRSGGLGRGLYEAFFAAASLRGAREVRCVTSIVNRSSVAFHQRLGFALVRGDREIDGIAVHTGHDGRGGAEVLFVRAI